MSERVKAERAPSKRKGRTGGDSTSLMLMVLAAAAAAIAWRNLDKITAWLEQASVWVGAALTVAAPAAAAAAILLAGVWVARTIRRRRQAEVAKLGAKHLAALRAVGLARSLQEADGTPVVIRPTHTVDNDGEHTRYALPQGTSVGQVVAVKERFISELRIDAPADRITITPHKGLAHHLDITVPPPPLVLRERRPKLPDRTSWWDPIVIGQNEKTGADVVAKTWDTPVMMVGGKTGSGKSVAVRSIVAHAALDPTVRMVGIDLKGSADDWADIRPRFEEWIPTSGDPAEDGPLLIGLLDRLYKEAHHRQGIRGRDYAPIFVLIEEVTSMLNAMSTKDALVLNGRLSRLAKTCRSANMTILYTVQQASVKDLPPIIRGSADFVLCLRMNRNEESKMLLGHIPTDYDVSKFATGHGIVAGGAGADIKVMVDNFTDAAWTRFCARFAATAVAPVESVPPLLAACRDIVTADPGGVLTPSMLHAALPQDVRPATVQAMSATLKEHGWSSRTPRKIGGVSTRLYHAADVPGALVVDAGSVVAPRSSHAVSSADTPADYDEPAS